MVQRYLRNGLSSQSLANLEPSGGEFIASKPSKTQLHSGSQNRAIQRTVKPSKKMQGSRSTQKLELQKGKGLSSVHGFYKAPKVATKKDIYNKVTRRNLINLVSSVISSMCLLTT